MSNILKGKLGWKGARGYSAYEIAVQNGYEGTEQDWLATLGTSSHFNENYELYTITDVDIKQYNLPTTFATGTFVSAYLNGTRLNQDEYSIDEANSKIIIDDGVSLSVNDKLEIVENFLSTNNLPIVDTIDSESTNDTAVGALCVYNAIKEVSDDVSTLETIVSGLETQILLAAHPINSVYIGIDNTNPSTLFGGTWSLISEGRCLVGVGTGTDSNNNTKEFVAGNNIGEYTHTLTVEELATHNHSVTYCNTSAGTGNAGLGGGYTATGSHVQSTTSTGGNEAHNNVQPTFGVYIWKRTA